MNDRLLPDRRGPGAARSTEGRRPPCHDTAMSSVTVREALARLADQVFVSVAAAWEIAIKVSLASSGWMLRAHGKPTDWPQRGPSAIFPREGARWMKQISYSASR